MIHVDAGSRIIIVGFSPYKMYIFPRVVSGFGQVVSGSVNEPFSDLYALSFADDAS